MSGLRFSVVSVPLHDTGIGRDAGYANDAEFREAMQRKREALDPAARAVVERVDERLADAFLHGVPRS